MNNDLDVMEAKIANKLELGAPLIPIAANKSGGVMFTNFGQVIDFAREMSIASLGVRKHLRGNVGACVAVIVQAIEWEMSPFAVASKSYNVNDVLAYEAQLINAVILRRAPIKGRFHPEYSGDDDAPRLRVWVDLRDEDGGGQLDYKSPPFHKISPKNSPLWKSDPEQQLFYYSSRALCRRHFPDVLLGVYAVDEILDSEPFDTKRGRNPNLKTLGARLDALAAEPNHDPDTGEILDNEQTPTSQTSTDRRDEAAADRTVSVERRAEPTTPQDLEGGSAPDPHRETGGEASPASPPATSPKPPGDGEAAILADLTATGASTAKQGAGPLSAWLDRLESFERKMLPDDLVLGWVAIAHAHGKAPTPSAEKAFPSDEAKRARRAEIEREGEAAAQGGEVVLNNYLDGLADVGEAGLVTSIKRKAWREMAKAVRR